MRLSHLICRLTIISSMLGGGAPAVAQKPDPLTASAEKFFGTSRIYTFHLTIDADEFASMQPDSGQKWFATTASGSRKYIKVKAHLEFDGLDMGYIGIRYKGNVLMLNSKNELKRSLKLDFNEQDKEKTFFGLKKLNLNSNTTDPSQLREALGYYVFRESGIPAPRTAFGRVYLTVPGRYSKQYSGLYTVVEQVDQRFLKDRFGKKTGLLLKPELLNGLPDLGDEWGVYGKQYREKIETDPMAARRFISFVRFLKESSDQDFAKNIGEFLDLQEFLGFLAIETIIVNLDSPLTLNHNYYITINPTTNRMVWIPWDLNKAFGGLAVGNLPAEDLSVTKPCRPGKFKLADRVLSIPSLNEEYRRLVKEIVSKNLTEKRMDELLKKMAETIRDAVQEDKLASLEEFEKTFSGPGTPAKSGGENANPPLTASKPSIQVSRPPGKQTGISRRRDGTAVLSREFLSNRRASIMEQLEDKRQGWTPNAMSLSDFWEARRNRTQPSKLPETKATGNQ